MRKGDMHCQCKLVLRRRPMRIKHSAVNFKLRSYSWLVWSYHELSLDVGVKLFYTVAASLSNFVN